MAIFSQGHLATLADERISVARLVEDPDSLLADAGFLLADSDGSFTVVLGSVV